MTFLRSWLLSVTACAVLVSIAQQLTDGGAMKKIVRFVGGMGLMLVMPRPPLSLPRLRGKRCSPFGLSFPPRGARKAPAPLRAQKKSTLTGALFQIAEN